MRSKRGSRFGSGGGSGNFLFDIIRVRFAIETCWRYFRIIHLFVISLQLIAGSGTSPEKDEEQNAPREERDGDSIDSNDVNGSSSSFNSDDSYTAGIPGPLTRLFILANRGISNLIQDLILVSSIWPVRPSDHLCSITIYIFQTVMPWFRSKMRTRYVRCY